MWTMGDRKISLVITWTPSSRSDNGGAEHQNHELIDAFIADHPEWSESFDAIIARALSPDGDSGWATVYSKGSGYVEASTQQTPIPAVQ
jgi:hypothetical protein